MSIGGTEEGQRVLFSGGKGQRRQQDVIVTDGRYAVDGNAAGDLQTHLAEVVDVASRL